MEAVIGTVIVIIILFVIFFAWIKFSNSIIKRKEKSMAEKHFIIKLLSKLNDNALKQEIEESINLEFNKKPTNVFITKNYLITSKNEIIPLKEILWIYTSIINAKSFSTGNTLGTQVTLNIVLDNGKKKKYYEKDKLVANEIISEVHKNAQWIITGYTKELEKEIQSNLQKFVENKNLQISKKD